MTITIDEARKKLGPEYDKLPNEEIQRMLDYMYFVCDFAINRHKNHPGEDFLNRKSTEPASKLNKERHLDNKMPPKATLDQKIKWHIEHIAHCKCRPIPDSIKKEIKRRIG